MCMLKTHDIYKSEVLLLAKATYVSEKQTFIAIYKKRVFVNDEGFKEIEFICLLMQNFSEEKQAIVEFAKQFVRRFIRTMVNSGKTNNLHQVKNCIYQFNDPDLPILADIDGYFIQIEAIEDKKLINAFIDGLQAALVN